MRDGELGLPHLVHLFENLPKPICQCVSLLCEERVPCLRSFQPALCEGEVHAGGAETMS